MTKGEDILIRRVAEMIKVAQPGSDDQLRVATRIGLLLQNQIILNVRRQRLIDTGNLINSIQHRVSTLSGTGFTVEAGSFGVPYAAIHEYGFNGIQNVRAFRRFQSKAFGRPMAKPRMVDVKPFSRHMTIRARPYVRPAFRQVRARILEMVQSLFTGKGE